MFKFLSLHRTDDIATVNALMLAVNHDLNNSAIYVNSELCNGYISLVNFSQGLTLHIQAKSLFSNLLINLFNPHLCITH